MPASETDGNRLTVPELRASLLNWYPFPDGTRALLLGNHTEALRPLLEKHYKTVEESPVSGEHYDCIVGADLIEDCRDVPALLHRLRTALADDGVLLLSARNRFGLKYLCGGVDEYVRTPFAVLDPQGTGARLYSRGETERLLLEAGFGTPYCYFLMPDAGFVQAVFTEDRLPDDSFRDRVFPFDMQESPLVAWEGDLYDDLVREKTLPEHANVYLFECRNPGAELPGKRAVYAALSTDRGSEHGFATVLYSDGTAAKLPLHPEGRASLAVLYRNLEALRERGILTVPQKLTERGIEMPLVQEEGLLHYLRRKLTDPEAFLDVFSRIYQDVLASSPTAAGLPAAAGEEWGAGPEQLAPVLEKAYIDMIPYNAFWSDGRIRYYDQEFTVENCPAKYVLFRALRYTWLHIPEAESVLPLESVRERFGLSELWNSFQRREDRFVGENRNWASLAQIYAHSQPDRAGIARRRQQLDPSAPLKEVHGVELELLRELDRVCEANGLRYMAVHGTLLGAVRHHGFIPWDDDVDVAMPREDYDRLLALGAEAFRPGFFLQTPRNNYGCFYGGYSKLRRDGTEALERRERRNRGNGYHTGIWIDIFPLDSCPEKPEKRRSLQKRLNFLQRIVFSKAYAPGQYVPEDIPGPCVSFYYLLGKCFRRRDLVRRIDRICRSQAPSSLLGILACYYGKRENRNIWPEEAFRSVVRLPFENMRIPVPEGWEAVLRQRYGADYMKLPPVGRRYSHSDIVFRTRIGE